jgi:hypothetical protein
VKIDLSLPTQLSCVQKRDCSMYVDSQNNINLHSASTGKIGYQRIVLFPILKKARLKNQQI